MSTSAIPAYGTLLKLGDGGTPTETFTTIAELTKIGGLKISLQEEDATHHGSGGWEEVIGTLLSGGEIACEANYIPTDSTQNSSTGVLAQILGRTKKNWKMVLPNTSQTTFSFAAITKNFEFEAEPKGKLKMSFTLKISGAVSVA